MKMKFTLLPCVLLLFCLGTASAQTSGDFRSNGTGGGNWTSNATWETFTTGWGPAGGAPDATSGLITIRAGDSVFLPAPLTIDQVVVDNGGIFTMTGGTITLNNTPAGSAIDNSGKVYVALSGVLAGAGTVLNRTTGAMTIGFTGTLAVNTTNNGTVNFTQTAAVQANTLTNNNLINWIDGTLFLLDAGTIANATSSSLFQIQAAGTLGLSTNATGTLINSSGATIFLTDPSLNLTVSGAIAFTNNGTVKGFGQADFAGTTVASNGNITPGNGATPAILTLGPSLAGIGTPTFNIGINSSGGTAGTNYSQVALTAGINLSASAKTLTVTDDPASTDPPTTVYTLFTAASGAFSGNFTTVNLPPSLGALAVTPTAITVTRNFTLPLTWGSFTVTAIGTQAQLEWTTLQESNTANFIIERSADGSSFTAIGTVKAAGNSSDVSSYSFTDVNPSQQGFNYYRLQQTDLDGKKTYSIVNLVSFGKERSVLVQTTPNPVKDLLNITVQTENITIIVNDMNGRSLKILRLAPGFHQAGFGDLPAGVYQLAIYKGSGQIDSRQIIKL